MNPSFISGGPVEVALDVTAVPEHPAGAGRYIVELARALALRDDCGLRLVSRRDNTTRWGELVDYERVLAVAPPGRVPRLFYEQARLASVVSGLREPPVAVHHGPHYTMPRRSKLPCVVTVHDMTFFDHPEWHEPSKVLFFRAGYALLSSSCGRDHLCERDDRQSAAGGALAALSCGGGSERCGPGPFSSRRRDPRLGRRCAQAPRFAPALPVPSRHDGTS